MLIVGVLLGIGIISLTGDARKALEQPGIDAEHASQTVPMDMNDWCAEHRVPESQCTRCHPELVTAFQDRDDWCGEHNLPESHCRVCNPRLRFMQEPEIVIEAKPIVTSIFLHPNAEDCATNNATIQFASVETSSRAGLTVEAAIRGSAATMISAPAETRFDETKLVIISSTIDATVMHWLAEPGDLLAEGQAIAELQSPEMATLQANFLEARADGVVAENNRRRADSLVARGHISRAEYESLAAVADVSRSRVLNSEGLLRSAGMTREDINRLAETNDVSPRWIVRSSVTGSLLERRAPLGEQLEAGATLALTGDPKALWLEAHMREHELSDIHVGQSVSFSSDGTLGNVAGEVIWVAQYLDEATRTGVVRARLAQPSRNLRANNFGRMTIEVNPSFTPVLVPKDAVQWEGCCNVVFVQEAADRFRPRKVTLARGDNRYYQVVSGVEVGESIVVNGSYLLKTELRKSSLGAGCCEVDAK